jgi:adenylylsulfate kinase
MTAPQQSPNTTRTSGRVPRAERERLLCQRGCVVWMTGLSGSGKSTIAQRLERRLVDRGHLAYVLDGDNLRHGLCGDLGFTPADRAENIRRAGEAAALLADVGAIVVAAFISPYREDRQRVRATVGDGRFVEVHVDAPLQLCEQRDPKGLYKRARAGEIREFTGIDAPYEPPTAPDLKIDTGSLSVDEAAAAIEHSLERAGLLAPPAAEGRP